MKEVKMFLQKLYPEETYFWWDNSITWSYATGVMCILTRKYQGSFCSSLYGTESLLWLNTEETLQAVTTFIIYYKNKDTRLQIILCKLEIYCFPFIKKWLVITCTYIIIISTFSCMLSLMSKVGEGKSIV